MDSMLSSLRSIKLDPLLTMLISAVILAIIVPARGDFAEWFSTGTKFAVALLFYLYGARLSTAEAIRGLTHWRLHLMILSCTFVLFPWSVWRFHRCVLCSVTGCTWVFCS